MHSHSHSTTSHYKILHQFYKDDKIISVLDSLVINDSESSIDNTSPGETTINTYQKDNYNLFKTIQSTKEEEIDYSITEPTYNNRIYNKSFDENVFAEDLSSVYNRLLLDNRENEINLYSENSLIHNDDNLHSFPSRETKIVDNCEELSTMNLVADLENDEGMLVNNYDHAFDLRENILWSEENQGDISITNEKTSINESKESVIDLKDINLDLPPGIRCRNSNRKI